MLLPALMKRHGSDLLLSPLPEAPLFRGIRSVVLVHDLIPLRFPRVTPLLAYHMTYLPLVLQQAERVLCNSLSTARDVHQRLKVPHHKLQPISLGVNPNQFYPLDRQREPFFLVLGRHDPHKNLKRVLKAFAALSCPEVQLQFVGPHHTSYTSTLQRLAKELQIDGRCQWYPWVSDGERLELLNRCQALLIPSLWEGFGLPALEAMACGTPVIGGNQGALPEVLGEVGLLVDPLRTEAITSAMQRLISEPQLSAQLAGPGVHRAAQYSWSTTAQQVQRVITALA